TVSYGHKSLACRIDLAQLGMAVVQQLFEAMSVRSKADPAMHDELEIWIEGGESLRRLGPEIHKRVKEIGHPARRTTDRPDIGVERGWGDGADVLFPILLKGKLDRRKGPLARPERNFTGNDTAQVPGEYAGREALQIRTAAKDEAPAAENTAGGLCGEVVNE